MLGVKVPDHLQADAELLCGTMREAGALGLKLLGQKVKHWAKSDGSVVTEADLAIDKFLRERLHGARPTYGWLSEETPDNAQRLTCSKLWVVDPIDGTQSFVNGTDGWCIGAALIDGERPVLSVLYRPMVDEFYFAAVGCGAWCNQQRLQPRDGVLLDKVELVGTGKALKVLAAAGVHAVNSPHHPLLLRLAFVAQGRTDIALSIGNKNDWDLAAGDLLVQEAGAKLSTLDGNQMIYNKPEPWQNGMVAAGPLRHATLMTYLETL